MKSALDVYKQTLTLLGLGPLQPQRGSSGGRPTASSIRKTIQPKSALRPSRAGRFRSPSVTQNDRFLNHTISLAFDQTARSFLMISAARSPMMTQGAMVLPVVTFGMIEASAMRSPSMP
jgi:hypothetical protein